MAGGAWVPIGAVQTSSGFDVAWKVTGADEYSVWTVDSNGNYISSTAAMSGSSSTLESYETIFNQDLNGDGVIGVPAGHSTTSVAKAGISATEPTPSAFMAWGAGNDTFRFNVGVGGEFTRGWDYCRKIPAGRPFPGAQ